MSELPPSSPEPPAARPNTVRTWVISGIVAAVVAVAVVVGLHFATAKSKTTTAAASATSQPGRGQRLGGGFTTGTIAAVDGSKITLTEANGSTATVDTDAKTQVSERTTGSLSDVTVGSTVRVLGTSSGGQLAARSITVGDDGLAGGPGGGGGGGGRFRQRNGGPGNGGTAPSMPPQAAGDMVNGKVTAKNGSTFTVDDTGRGGRGTTTSTTAAGGSTMVTVTTSSDTTVTVVKALKVSDLHKGDKVAVLGTTNGTTITATAIIEGDLNGGFGGRFGNRGGGGNGNGNGGGFGGGNGGGPPGAPAPGGNGAGPSSDQTGT